MEDAGRELTDDLYAGLEDFVRVYRDNLDAVLQVQEGLVAGLPPEMLARAGAEADEAGRAQRAEESLAELESAVAGRDMEAYMAERLEQVEQLAITGVPYDTIAHSLVVLLEPLGAATLAAFADDSERGNRARDALGWLKSEMLIVAGRAYATVRESQVEDEFQKVIRGLSTPVIQVWDRILVMPLIGVIDSTRARQLMEQLLDRIVALQSEIVILDVTGVPTVDTQVADHLVRTTKAAALVGARTVLVGISPEVAQTLVRLGATLGEVETRANLRSGLEAAFAGLGLRVVADQ